VAWAELLGRPLSRLIGVAGEFEAAHSTIAVVEKINPILVH
jgi:hypothetical protein